MEPDVLQDLCIQTPVQELRVDQLTKVRATTLRLSFRHRNRDQLLTAL
jgi:hypothetical protein